MDGISRILDPYPSHSHWQVYYTFLSYNVDICLTPLPLLLVNVVFDWPYSVFRKISHNTIDVRLLNFKFKIIDHIQKKIQIINFPLVTTPTTLTNKEEMYNFNAHQTAKPLGWWNSEKLIRQTFLQLHTCKECLFMTWLISLIQLLFK